MRGALVDHPKVIAIGRELQRNKDFREWATPGGSGSMNGQLLSDHALRCVTTALLMRVWSVAREHGKFAGDDLVLEYSSLPDIDQMAGAPGIGDAMKRVKWVKEENGLTLPNFKEFNVPMTAAEKQKEYRDRNKKGNDTVTEALPTRSNENSQNVTTREEKRRTKYISKKRTLPDDWKPNPSTIATLCQEFNLSATEGKKYEEAFRDMCRAKGYKYSDFDAAFRNCVRQDWPKLRNGSAVGPERVSL